MTSYALPRRRGLFARLHRRRRRLRDLADLRLGDLADRGHEGRAACSYSSTGCSRYVPNSVYYGVTQYIPFLQLSAEVGFLVANGVAWTNVVLVVILGLCGPGLARAPGTRLAAAPPVRAGQLRRRRPRAHPVLRVQRGRRALHPAQLPAHRPAPGRDGRRRWARWVWPTSTTSSGASPDGRRRPPPRHRSRQPADAGPPPLDRLRLVHLGWSAVVLVTAGLVTVAAR